MNWLRGSVVKNDNTIDTDQLAKFMKDLIQRNDYLANLVDQGKLSTKQRWQKIDEIDFDFPDIDLEELPQLFFGSYHIKQSQT